MSKKIVKPRKEINWEEAIPTTIFLIIVLAIVLSIIKYASGSDERKAIAQVEQDLLRNQKVNIMIHQPNKIEVYYEYIESVHNEKTYSERERRYLINSRFIINVSYNNDRLYVKSDINQRDYNFRNITYREWNEAFLQLEERDYKGNMSRDENMEIPQEGED